MRMKLRPSSRQAAPVVPLPAKKSSTVSPGLEEAADDAPQDAQRFLRGVTGLFFAIGGHDGVPPGVGGQLAARGFLRSHQPGCHVGNALNGVIVEGVMLRILGVPEDVIVLGRPLLARARAVVVRPDDLVQKALAPEDLVQQHLAVMHLAVINVKVQAARGRENPFGFHQARLDKGEEIVKDVAVGFGTQLTVVE